MTRHTSLASAARRRARYPGHSWPQCPPGCPHRRGVSLRHGPPPNNPSWPHGRQPRRADRSRRLCRSPAPHTPRPRSAGATTRPTLPADPVKRTVSPFAGFTKNLIPCSLRAVIEKVERVPAEAVHRWGGVFRRDLPDVAAVDRAEMSPTFPFALRYHTVDTLTSAPW